MPTEIYLYQYESSTIKIVIRVFFNEENHLIFEGSDFGKKKGGADYEYSYKIKPSQVNNLARVLKVKDPHSENLLVTIRDRFEGKDAYCQFGAFMDEHEIEFTKFN
ncbi:hypothetical protein LV84_01038 [Algoriphagus ratkowskyi]|uniref:Uncharacterized protein n=1 Tax=Algoriphagus ratkowskyi TaxID=57028 RepID=A0A2W7RYY6_9BACT|nr:hypothetical protein [Algoriphagus ratkowskyi]PZX59829.1 hypothetical protein LV84_01038 [Algoriphagus ratkowskyi]TXD78463.1 hypothetical protein ESW18_06635 [Algoriphagus ratkowskyi]